MATLIASTCRRSRAALVDRRVYGSPEGWTIKGPSQDETTASGEW